MSGANSYEFRHKVKLCPKKFALMIINVQFRHVSSIEFRTCCEVKPMTEPTANCAIGSSSQAIKGRDGSALAMSQCS